MTLFQYYTKLYLKVWPRICKGNIGRWHDKIIGSVCVSPRVWGRKRATDWVNKTLSFVKLHSVTSKATDPFEQVLLKIVLNNLCASLGFEWSTWLHKMNECKKNELTGEACLVRNPWSCSGCGFSKDLVAAFH